ncbi:hypothetical protein DFQ14_11134 [Halopolyspora algeriensis]|uniref:Uncharacterized protein n=1 Tax=Halopolyspora algeriensis TaxID=1500506 RepID=A0A368VL37_9ACTN|nr:hypothetical protein DFQ14_11134 [Halopolyspora algeriensis]TQM53669.1 hypothetical protein FHU43_1831 [Halopolyspora algeriensis]
MFRRLFLWSAVIGLTAVFVRTIGPDVRGYITTRRM